MLRNRLSAALILLAAGAEAGCGSSEDQAREPTALDAVRAKLDRQGLALLPFDTDDASCAGDLALMDRQTLLRCAQLDPSRVPESMVVTTDATLFDPAPERTMMLVVRGLTPKAEGWIAILGLGPVPQAPSSLVTSSKISPLVAPALVLAGPPLFEGASTLLTWGVGLLGATAVVVVANEAVTGDAGERIVRGTEESLIEQTSRLTCEPDEHRELARAKDKACYNLPTSCTRLVGVGGAAMCVGLDLRRREFQKCLDARQEVVDRCFGGTPSDDAHREQIETMRGLVESCDSLIRRVCP